MADDEKRDALLEEATDWLLRLQDVPRGSEAALRFEDWLARSPAHGEAWEKACRAWRLMGEVPPAYEHLWNPGAGAGLPFHHRVNRRRSPRPRVQAWAVAAAGVAATLLILVVFGPSVLLRMEADYVTATGQSRAITLADGTQITLGADSAIASDLTGRERRVTLISGEAFFDVAHDGRPFVVDAGGVGVTVLGTAFNVQLTSDAATVALARGSVRVAFKDDSTVLVPGEMVAVDRQTGGRSLTAIAQDDIGAWRSGFIFVNGATIAAVAEQLQRYHSAWIKVPDGQLAAQTVTGLYDVRDPDRALRALVQPYGGKVHHISPYLRVLSRL